MKTCPLCHREFEWRDYGSSTKFDQAVVCPDCDGAVMFTKAVQTLECGSCQDKIDECFDCNCWLKDTEKIVCIEGNTNLNPMQDIRHYCVSCFEQALRKPREI